jgi:hypothetical protein
MLTKKLEEKISNVESSNQNQNLLADDNSEEYKSEEFN